RPDYRHVRFGDRDIGAGYLFVTLCLLRALDRGNITLHQSLLATVRRFTPGQYRVGAHDRRRGLRKSSLVRRYCGASASDTRLLLCGVKDSEFLPFRHTVPRVGRKRGEGGADLEADAAEDPRFDGAEPVYAKDHTTFGLNDRDCERAFGEEQGTSPDSHCK